MKFVCALRSVVYWLLFSASILCYSLVLLICMPFSGQNLRYSIIKSWCGIAVKLMRAICGVKYDFQGLENIPSSGPVLLMAKHQSGWEPLALTAFLPRRISYIYKKELHKIPLFGWGLASLGMLSIDRAHGRNSFAVLKREVPKFFAKGWAILIFPEGTRTAPGQVVKYKSGGARLAVDCGAPVVPIALNSGECWPKHSFIIYPGLIKVVIGKEIKTESMSYQGLNDAVQDSIESEMKCISPRYYQDRDDTTAGK